MTIRNKYPAMTMYPPLMLHTELRVTTTGETSDITPTSGKSIRVFGFIASQFVTSSLTSTLRATLAFGTDHTTDADKILAAYRQNDVYDDAGLTSLNINVIGEVDEVIRLTNVTFSAGGIVTRVVVYYAEE